METIQFSCRLSAQNYARLEELAQASGVNRTAALNVILSAAFAAPQPPAVTPPAPAATEETTSLDWLSPEQLAAELQIPLQTLYVWRSRKKGPRGHKIGVHVRYSRADINAWLATAADGGSK